MVNMTLTPKEKAVIIFAEFFNFFDSDGVSGSSAKDNAKRMAKNAADINIAYKPYTDEQREYWEQVKNEIDSI